MENDEILEKSRENDQFHTSVFINIIQINAYKLTTLLADRAVFYRLTKEDPFVEY
jgi:hypothetical protein